MSIFQGQIPLIKRRTGLHASVIVALTVSMPVVQDGPKNVWDTGHVAFYLLPRIKRHNIRAIITFDDYGVSGALP